MPGKSIPSLDASEHCQKYKWGDDSKLYKSVPDKKKTCKWKLITPSKIAISHWTSRISNHPSLFGSPYDFKSYAVHNYNIFENPGLDKSKFISGTTIDINLQPEVELTLSNKKDYTLRGEDDIKEQEKHVHAGDLFKWYKSLLDELGYVSLSLVPSNPVVLVSTALFNIGDIFRDGIQFNIVLASKKPLSKSELSNALEGLTSMDAMGASHSIKLKANKKYTSHGTIYTRAGWAPTSSPQGNYKLTTWKADAASALDTSKNIKTTIVGKVDEKKMPTYPTVMSVIKKPNNTKPKPSAAKPKPVKKCPEGKVMGSSGRCVNVKKPSAAKPKPVKKCPEGKVMGSSGRCVNVKKPSAAKPKPAKKCPEGKVMGSSGRCVNVKKPSAAKPKVDPKPVEKRRPMNCFRQTAKKYTSPTRKSPPFKANLCCGEIMTGNDGNKWESVPNVKGICTWKPLK